MNFQVSGISVEPLLCNSVSTVTRIGVGRSKFYSQKGKAPFLFATASRPVLVPIQHPIHWVPRDLPSSGNIADGAWS